MRALRALGLSTVSVENIDPTPIPNHAVEDVFNTASDMADISTDLELANASDVAYESLRVIAKELDVALVENGGLTVEESNILTKEYLDLLARAKVSAPLCPSMESYGINDFHREEATKLLLQNVVLSTEGILDKILAGLKYIWEKIKKFFYELFTKNGKKINQLEAAAKLQASDEYKDMLVDVIKKNGAEIQIFEFGNDDTLRAEEYNGILMNIVGGYNRDAHQLMPRFVALIIKLADPQYFKGDRINTIDTELKEYGDYVTVILETLDEFRESNFKKLIELKFMAINDPVKRLDGSELKLPRPSIENSTIHRLKKITLELKNEKTYGIDMGLAATLYKSLTKDNKAIIAKVDHSVKLFNTFETNLKSHLRAAGSTDEKLKGELEFLIEAIRLRSKFTTNLLAANNELLKVQLTLLDAISAIGIATMTAVKKLYDGDNSPRVVNAERLGYSPTKQ